MGICSSYNRKLIASREIFELIYINNKNKDIYINILINHRNELQKKLDELEKNYTDNLYNITNKKLNNVKRNIIVITEWI